MVYLMSFVHVKKGDSIITDYTSFKLIENYLLWLIIREVNEKKLILTI